MFRKYPALPLLGAAIFGIVLADQTHLPSWQFLVAALVCACIALFLLARSAWRTAAVFGVLTAGSLSGFHFVISYLERGPDHVSRIVSTRDVVRIYGQISDWPDLRSDRTEYLIDLDSVLTTHMRRADGRILLKVTDTTTSLQRGDRIECFGRIYFFDPAATRFSPYLRRLNLKGVAGTVYLPTLLDVRVDRRSPLGLFAAVDRVRTLILGSFERNLSPPSAALAGGFVLGETRHIGTDVYAMFRDSGTLHVLAVSGSNVALVILFVLLVLRPFGISQPWRGVILLTVVMVFALLSFGQPSVIRASTMAVFILVAGMLGREYDLNHIVSLTVLCILAYEPGQLYDVGFQLSVVCAWGLVLLVKPVGALFVTWHNRRWYRWLVFPIIVSLVAQLCSSPLIAYYFGRVPAATVMANLVVVPLTSLAVMALMVLLLADLVWPVLGFFAGSLVDPLLRLIIESLRWFKALNLPQLNFGPLAYEPFSILWILVYFALLICFCFAIHRKMARRMAVFVLLTGANMALLVSVVQGKEPRESVHLSGLPGGIVAVIDQPRSGESDLIFSSTLLKIDDLDTRLLQPVLEMNRVKKLRFLFVMVCPYDNIDDLMRLALMYQCSTMYVSAPYRPSFEDYQAYHDQSVRLPEVIYFGGVPAIDARRGYILGEGRIQVVTEDRSILFVDRPAEDLPSSSLTSASEQVLVLATRWSPRPDDWIALRQQGFTRLICSRIERIRVDTDSVLLDDQVDQVLPDYIIDLRRTGPYRLPM